MTDVMVKSVTLGQSRSEIFWQQTDYPLREVTLIYNIEDNPFFLMNKS